MMELVGLINQYGPVMGLTVIVTLSIVYMVRRLSDGQAAKMTASAAVVNAQATAMQTEAETQRGMNSIALKMVNQQEEHHRRFNQAMDKLREVEVHSARIHGEHEANLKLQEQIRQGWMQQVSLIEEMRQGEKQKTERLEKDLNHLRLDVEKTLDRLNAALADNEKSKTENEQLRATNAELEKKETEYLQQIDELKEEIRLLKEENQQLNRVLENQNQRITQLEAEAARSKTEEPPATPLPELVN